MAVAGSLAASSPAFAQQNEIDYGPLVAEFGRDQFRSDPTTAHLYFSQQDCLEFCIIVEFGCDGTFTLTMNYFDSAEVINWLTLQGGGVDTTPMRLTLARGGAEDDLQIDTIILADGPAAYFVTTMRRFFRPAWYAAFATGDLFIATPSRTLELPGTPADLAERAAFADACSTLAAR